MTLLEDQNIDPKKNPDNLGDVQGKPTSQDGSLGGLVDGIRKKAGDALNPDLVEPDKEPGDYRRYLTDYLVKVEKEQEYPEKDVLYLLIRDMLADKVSCIKKNHRDFFSRLELITGPSRKRDRGVEKNVVAAIYLHELEKVKQLPVKTKGGGSFMPGNTREVGDERRVLLELIYSYLIRYQDGSIDQELWAAIDASLPGDLIQLDQEASIQHLKGVMSARYCRYQLDEFLSRLWENKPTEENTELFLRYIFRCVGLRKSIKPHGRHGRCLDEDEEFYQSEKRGFLGLRYFSEKAMELVADFFEEEGVLEDYLDILYHQTEHLEIDLADIFKETISYQDFDTERFSWDSKQWWEDKRHFMAFLQRFPKLTERFCAYAEKKKAAEEGQRLEEQRLADAADEAERERYRTEINNYLDNLIDFFRQKVENFSAEKTDPLIEESPTFWFGIDPPTFKLMRIIRQDNVYTWISDEFSNEWVKEFKEVVGSLKDVDESKKQEVLRVMQEYLSCIQESIESFVTNKTNIQMICQRIDDFLRRHVGSDNFYELRREVDRVQNVKERLEEMLDSHKDDKDFVYRDLYNAELAAIERGLPGLQAQFDQLKAAEEDREKEEEKGRQEEEAAGLEQDKKEKLYEIRKDYLTKVAESGIKYLKDLYSYYTGIDLDGYAVDADDSSGGTIGSMGMGMSLGFRQCQELRQELRMEQHLSDYIQVEIGETPEMMQARMKIIDFVAPHEIAHAFSAYHSNFSEEIAASYGQAVEELVSDIASDQKDDFQKALNFILSESVIDGVGLALAIRYGTTKLSDETAESRLNTLAYSFAATMQVAQHDFFDKSENHSSEYLLAHSLRFQAGTEEIIRRICENPEQDTADELKAPLQNVSGSVQKMNELNSNLLTEEKMREISQICQECIRKGFDKLNELVTRDRA